ncbi:MAG: hypothetical protein ACRD0W_11410 [Acidimicrobiales bacterium]
MAAEDRTSRRTQLVGGRRRGRARALGMLAAIAAGVTACAHEADPADVVVGDVEYEATPEFLAAAAERSQAERYRMEMRKASAGGDEVVVETGEQDGERFRVRQDLGAELGQLLPAAADADLSIEHAGDGSTLYVRMPAFAAMRELTPGFAIVPFGDLVDQLGDGWGRVDLAELADVMPGLQDAANTVEGYFPRLFVDVVTKAQDVEELGHDEIRGVAVNGLAAEVPFEDIWGAHDSRVGAIEMMNDITVPIEVWVDGDGLLRRVSFGFHHDEVGRALGAEGDGALTGGPAVQPDVDYTLDLFDYGDESISIEFPTDAVDVTDAYRQMLESGRAVLIPSGDGG